MVSQEEVDMIFRAGKDKALGILNNLVRDKIAQYVATQKAMESLNAQRI